MKIVLNLTLIIAVIVSTLIGCLVIFEILTVDQGMEYLLKALAVIFLVGISSVLVRLVTMDRNTSGD